VSVVVRTYGFDPFSGPSTSEEGIGTGFIVDSEGLILTNSHVVDSRDGEYSVVMKDGQTYDVQKVHLDQIQDIAILEIDAENLPTVVLGDSDQLKVGQRAIAIGNALGRFQNTITVGVVSGIGRAINASAGFGTSSTAYDSVIQTDAALNPGNSGGPLLNSAGQVIGMNVATTPGADNISFAIPVNTLKPLLDTFLREGRLVRPFLGINYVMITKEVAQLRRLPEGAFISRVYADTPASRADIKRGDIITAINGNSLSGGNSLGAVIAKFKVDETVEIDIDRNGSKLKTRATLAETPDQL
jgi:serine protease Do